MGAELTGTVADHRPGQVALVTGDWTSAAIAIHSILQIRTPMFLRLIADGYPQILIDFRFRAYESRLPLAAIPDRVSRVSVETQPTTSEGPPLFELPGGNLDALLWGIGLRSFDGGPASWIRPNERYHLARWPNLTQLSHTPEHMRLIALLGARFVSPVELAHAAVTDEASAMRVINALSLMGVLENSDVAPAPRLAERGRVGAANRGLFARLRARLGV